MNVPLQSICPGVSIGHGQLPTAPLVVGIVLRTLGSAALDQGATANFPVGWYVVTKAWANRYPWTMAAFLTALREGQQIADTRRNAVKQAMEKLPFPYTVPPAIAAVMSLETYPLSIAPDIDRSRVQRVADEMYQFRMLSRPFKGRRRPPPTCARRGPSPRSSQKGHQPDQAVT